METCRVYKGLDTPCLIKGVYSQYFYIIFLSCILVGVVFVTNVMACLKGAPISSLLMNTIFSLLGVGLVYKYFSKRSHRPKITPDNREITYSNRELYQAINKRKHG
ncbi:hypothetical protein D0T87_15800 [Bacteroides sp. 51]|nr:hypothetical protein [Bacteroides sp. 51]